MIFYTYFGWDTPFENAVYDETAGACNVLCHFTAQSSRRNIQ